MIIEFDVLPFQHDEFLRRQQNTSSPRPGLHTFLKQLLFLLRVKLVLFSPDQLIQVLQQNRRLARRLILVENVAQNIQVVSCLHVAFTLGLFGRCLLFSKGKLLVL